MSHLRLLWINGAPIERPAPVPTRRRLPVETTSDGCRIAWMVLPTTTSTALTAPRSTKAHRMTTTLRGRRVPAVVAVLFALLFQLLAAVGMHLVLERPTLEATRPFAARPVSTP